MTYAREPQVIFLEPEPHTTRAKGAPGVRTLIPRAGSSQQRYAAGAWGCVRERTEGGTRLSRTIARLLSSGCGSGGFSGRVRGRCTAHRPCSVGFIAAAAALTGAKRPIKR